MLGKTEGKKRRGAKDYSITYSMDLNLSKFWEVVEDRGGLHATVLGVSKNPTGLRDRRATATTFAHKRVVATHLSLYQ